MAQRHSLHGQIPDHHAGQRLDQVLAALFPDYSRARLQQWLRDGTITVDGQIRRPRDRVSGGEWVAGEWAVVEDASAAEPIPLSIIFEDDDLLVIDKPAGLVVHPAVGNRDGTLVNALLHHDPALSHLPRAGIVHRLDKDTSGLLVVARSLRSHTALVNQLQARTVSREYLAVVHGTPVAGGTIESPIGRHPQDRKRMAVIQSGRPAITHYRIAQRFRHHTALRVNLETGRTHQIRVHLAEQRLPLIGDPVYGGRNRIPRGASATVLTALRGFRRQALHARQLAFQHPADGETVTFSAPLPDDLRQLIAILVSDTEQPDE